MMWVGGWQLIVIEAPLGHKLRSTTRRNVVASKDKEEVDCAGK